MWKERIAYSIFKLFCRISVMKELVVAYEKATIYFPMWIKRSKDIIDVKEVNNNPGKISGETVSFSRNGCVISASIFPYNIPHILSDNDIVQNGIVKPIIRDITKDIETIDEDIRFLEVLAAKKKVEGKFYYERELSGDEFRVYDYSRSTRVKGSEKILKLLNYPQKLLGRKYQEFYGIAKVLHQEEKHIPYVTGETLKEATKNILLLYSKLDKLDKLEI